MNTLTNMEVTTSEEFDRKETVESVPYIVYESAEARHERSNKRTLIALVIAIVLFFINNLTWIWYINQYDFANYEVSTDSGGNAYYNELVGDGQINYGESDSTQAN